VTTALQQTANQQQQQQLGQVMVPAWHEQLLLGLGVPADEIAAAAEMYGACDGAPHRRGRPVVAVGTALLQLVDPADRTEAVQQQQQQQQQQENLQAGSCGSSNGSSNDRVEHVLMPEDLQMPVLWTLLELLLLFDCSKAEAVIVLARIVYVMVQAAKNLHRNTRLQAADGVTSGETNTAAVRARMDDAYALLSAVLQLKPVLFATAATYSKAAGVPAAADAGGPDTALLCAFTTLVCKLTASVNHMAGERGLTGVDLLSVLYYAICATSSAVCVHEFSEVVGIFCCATQARDAFVFGCLVLLHHPDSSAALLAQDHPPFLDGVTNPDATSDRSHVCHAAHHVLLLLLYFSVATSDVSLLNHAVHHALLLLLCEYCPFAGHGGDVTQSQLAAVEGGQQAAIAGADIAAAVEAGLRACTARQMQAELEADAVGLSCAMVMAIVEQQQQQQQQRLAASQQVQQQLFTLLISTVKLISAFEPDEGEWKTAEDLIRVLRHAEVAAARLASSNSSSSSNSDTASSNGGGSSSRDAVAMWVLLMARTMVRIGQTLPAAANDYGEELWVGTASIADAARWISLQLPIVLDAYNDSTAAAAAAAQGPDQQPSSSRTSGRLLLQQLLSDQILPLQAIVANCKEERDTSQTAAEYYQLSKQLVSCGEALVTALPSKLCCNHSRCSNSARLSETELVSGKSCVCAR
jgi:hypothetical protein